MDLPVRVRFAPSPTGPLHIGGVRTALFNYLFAKKHGGSFILRIEDTDQNRYVAGAEDYIIEALDWLNIPFDESPSKEAGFGPYRQSERKEMYRQYATKLLDEGKAYYAFDTPDQLNQIRKELEAEGKTFIYNWESRGSLKNSLSMDTQEVTTLLEQGTPYVVRFKMPLTEDLQLSDQVRGKMSVNTKLLDDKILFKSDGMPTYHLANIVDDHLMQISHVIRGEEWLPSLALHVLLYEAFGWKSPEFAHLPLIMKPVGKGKLSKRDGDKMGFPVFPLDWISEDGDLSSGYREAGYLPEAVVNMLALLGWNPGTEQEIFSLEELTQEFKLERVNKAGAKFDPEKTKWFQHHYFQLLDNEQLVAQLENVLKDKGITTDVELSKVIPLVKGRASFVDELYDQGNFFFTPPKDFDEKASKKAFKEDTQDIMNSVVELINTTEPFDAQNLSDVIKPWIGEQGIGFGKVMMPLRLSLVGAMKGPDVFDIAEVLGREETVRRINFAVSTLS
ncbi:glutamate--tRNA ligase [Aureitalea marina]|uniref:Glutamate--tRNA ligase n=1 Tax=Aureitalea marina TaxID=930804 RepID=A0A2S7KSD2_9FLAO|nr:glutamate--tRNA ligase [Aureitalea marina]PQB05463.1 glutamate--tRNA ligase [Aureitalea marina]